MFNMFTQLFSSITVFFTAWEKLAKAILHLCTWAEKAAEAYADEATIEREAKLAVRMHDRAQAQLALDRITAANGSATPAQ